jgi:hypothetical protein
MTPLELLKLFLVGMDRTIEALCQLIPTTRKTQGLICSLSTKTFRALLGLLVILFVIKYLMWIVFSFKWSQILTAILIMAVGIGLWRHIKEYYL